MNRLKELRKKKGVTQSDVASFIGISQNNYSYWENGKVKIDAESMRRLAEYFGVTVDYILGRTEDVKVVNGYTPEGIINYPVIASVRAGYGGEIVEYNSGEFIAIPVEFLRGRAPEDYMVFEIKGDSMYPRYMNGDRVLVLRTDSVDSGKIAVIAYNGDEATVKKVEYKQGEDWLDLIPINPMYPIKRIQGADLEQCHVIGQVKMLLREEI